MEPSDMMLSVAATMTSLEVDAAGAVAADDELPIIAVKAMEGLFSFCIKRADCKPVITLSTKDASIGDNPSLFFSYFRISKLTYRADLHHR